MSYDSTLQVTHGDCSEGRTSGEQSKRSIVRNDDSTTEKAFDDPAIVDVVRVVSSSLSKASTADLTREVGTWIVNDSLLGLNYSVDARTYTGRASVRAPEKAIQTDIRKQSRCEATSVPAHSIQFEAIPRKAQSLDSFNRKPKRTKRQSSWSVDLNGAEGIGARKAKLGGR